MRNSSGLRIETAWAVCGWLVAGVCLGGAPATGAPASRPATAPRQVKARKRAKAAAPSKRTARKKAAAKPGRAAKRKAQPKTKAPPKPKAPAKAGASVKLSASAKGWARVDKKPIKVVTPSGVRAVTVKVFVNKLGMGFGRIVPGPFTMGSPETEPGRNGDELAHAVKIQQPYYLGVTEVTVSQWRRFIEQSGYGWARWREVALVSPTDAHPIVYVSWEDAVAFCQWLRKVDKAAYRLATEAEWEYACRAGAKTPFNFGDQADPRRMAYGRDAPTPSVVTALPANRWGLYGMHGSVWEWCGDWYSRTAYARAPTTSPVGPGRGDARVIRSGSWQDVAAYCRSANRSGRWPGGRYEDLGFRVVRVGP